MKKKLLLLLACALPVSAVSSHAQTAAATAAPAYTWKLTPAVVSNYMFRGMRLGEACFQPSLELGMGSTTLGVWASTPFDDQKVPGFSDPEIDVYGSHTLKLNDQLTLVPGFTWYLFPEADESLGFYKNTFEPNVALNWTVGVFTLTPKLYYDLVLKGPTAEFIAAYTIPVDGTGGIGVSATIGTYKWTEAAENSSPDVKNWGDYWALNATLPFTLAPNQTLTLGAGYHKGSNNFFKAGNLGKTRNTGALGRAVFSVAYSFTF